MWCLIYVHRIKPQLGGYLFVCLFTCLLFPFRSCLMVLQCLDGGVYQHQHHHHHHLLPPNIPRHCQSVQPHRNPVPMESRAATSAIFADDDWTGNFTSPAAKRASVGVVAIPYRSPLTPSILLSLSASRSR